MRREKKHSVYVDRYVTKNKLKKNYEFRMCGLLRKRGYRMHFFLSKMKQTHEVNTREK